MNHLLKSMIGAFLAGVFLFGSSATYAAEYSAVRTIARIQVVANSETTYLTTNEGGWGAAGCPAATYIQLLNTGGQYKTLLATAMTAKAANLTIRGFGDCDASGNYFVISQLVLQ